MDLFIGGLIAGAVIAMSAVAVLIVLAATWTAGKDKDKHE